MGLHNRSLFPTKPSQTINKHQPKTTKAERSYDCTVKHTREMDPNEMTAGLEADDVETAPGMAPAPTSPDTTAMKRSKHHKNKVSWGFTSPAPAPEPAPAPAVPPEIGFDLTSLKSPSNDLDLSSTISDPALRSAMNGHPLMNSTRATLAGMNELSNEAVSRK